MEHISHIFLANFFLSLSKILFEDLSFSFLSEYYNNFWVKIKASDSASLNKYLRETFVASLSSNENTELKISNSLKIATLHRFLVNLSESLAASFTIHFPNNITKVYEPEINLRGKPFTLKTDLEGTLNIHNEIQHLAHPCTDSESETEWPEMRCKKRGITVKGGSEEGSVQEAKKKRVPVKFSEPKNRNPFMEKMPEISFDTKYNLEQFTEKNEFQHYKDCIKVNLENLKENTERLNQILISNISKISALLPVDIEPEELSCAGKCPLHCSLLGRAQVVKKAKGRKGKNQGN